MDIDILNNEMGEALNKMNILNNGMEWLKEPTAGIGLLGISAKRFKIVCSILDKHADLKIKLSFLNTEDIENKNIAENKRVGDGYIVFDKPINKEIELKNIQFEIMELLGTLLKMYKMDNFILQATTESGEKRTILILTDGYFLKGEINGWEDVRELYHENALNEHKN